MNQLNFHTTVGGSGTGRRLRKTEAAYAQPETDDERAWVGAAADSMADWNAWDGPEARTEIEDERARVLEIVRRLAAEPGASAFVKALREALKGQPRARTAG
jgi:hypothetical protein